MPFAVISRSEPVAAAPRRLQRTEGEARIVFRRRDGATHLERLYQRGASKIRLPRSPAGDPPTAVLINTAGGLTGGDRLACEATVGADCRAVLTTQACEKIYRTSSGDVEIRTRLDVGTDARLDWLPQETILFDGGRLTRRLDADLAPGATLLLVEAVILGRTARGERMRSGLFADRWRIRRGERLIFADDLRFDWADAALSAKPAVLAGANAMATILFVSDGPDQRVDRVREVIGEAGAASAWNGKLVARLVAEDGAALRRALVPAIVELLDGSALPKLWQL